MPEAGRALVRQQVHRQAPPVAGMAEHPLAGNDHVVEEHLGELVDAVHRAQRPDGDPRGVHVHEKRGDAAVARGDAGEQHAARRVLGQARPDLLAGDHPGVAARGRPRAQRREVTSRAWLGESLAPLLTAAEQQRDHLGGQRRPRVGDHRRGEHLDHRVDPGLGQVAAGDLLAEHRPEHGRPAEAAHPRRPAVPHPARVVESAADPGQLRDLPVEGAVGPRGQVMPRPASSAGPTGTG